MPLSSSNLSALGKVAEFARSHEPADTRLRQILEVMREELRIGALSIVTAEDVSGEARSWHALGKDSGFSLAAIKSEALGALDDESGPRQFDGRYVLPIEPANGRRAAMVAHGKFDPKANSALLHIISSYVAVLLENDRLEEDAARSARETRNHIEEIAGLYEVGCATDVSDARPLLNRIVETAAAVMDAQACSLLIRNESGDAMVVGASCGLPESVITGTKVALGEGIAGRVAEAGEPMLIRDVASDPRFKGQVKPKQGISGSMCVPLKDEQGHVNGVLSIRRERPRPPFDDDDLKLFGIFATHAALAISNSQLYSLVHRKAQEMSRISEVLQAINSTLDLDHVLTQIVESITEVVGFDRCCVYLLDTRTGDFVAGARKGYARNDRIKDRIGFDEGVIGVAAKEKIPIFSQRSPIEFADHSREGELLVAPIVVRDECIGVVVVDNCSRSRPIDPRSVELLATFVSQAGIAVENARLYEAMEQKYAELNVLYEHSRGISAAYGLENAAEALVRTASKVIKCDGAGLLLLDERRGHLSLPSATGEVARRSPRIAKASGEAKSVEFIRGLRNPTLITLSGPESVSGAEIGLARSLAPAKSHVMLAPLVAEDTVVGALALCRIKGSEFEGAELKLASILTSHAATVLKNAVSYEQRMSQRVLELTALYEFSKKISSAANLGEALDSILAIVADLVDYDQSFIYAIDHERGTVSIKAARFRGKTQPIPEEPLDGNSVIYWAIRERKALVSPDISRDSRFTKPVAGRDSVRSLMAIPLIVQDEVVGVLSVHNRCPNQYTDEDVRVLSIIASQGAAIYKELEALTALTSYTDNILSSIAAGVVTLDSDGIALTWNNSAEKIVGVKAEQIVGFHYQEALSRLAISSQDKENLRRVIEGVFTTGETYQGYKLCFHPRNKDEIYMNMSISQLLNSAGDQLGLVIIFEDISREIKMEDEFRRMGELAAVGQLAASIAHELRNPLSSIKGAAQFLQKEYEDHGSIVEFLEIIIEEVNGLNKLTTEFLDFARPMELELRPTSINKVVEKTMHLMSVHITDNNVVVTLNLGKPIPQIQADEEQIEQVLKNMIINSLQAMPEGGVLSVETGATQSGGAYLVVSDTGMGIPPEKLDRIFTPFFTTKTKGTGLGLSVVHKIIENHGGKIEVSSVPGTGTAFHITLPRAGAQHPTLPDVDHTLERRSAGGLHG